MTYTNWDKLKMRLQAIAKNDSSKRQADKAHFNEGVALIKIKLIFKRGELVGWYRPERIELEPKSLDWLDLSFNKVIDDWDNVIDDLQKSRMDCILIVSSGLPVAWFA